LDVGPHLGTPVGTPYLADGSGTVSSWHVLSWQSFSGERLNLAKFFGERLNLAKFFGERLNLANFLRTS
jgi:hypothetical protein